MTIRWHWWTILIFNLISLIYSLQSLDANSVRVDSDGSVKVKVNGVEGRICATDWDDKDAEVLCRGFGWSNSAAYNSSGDSNIPTLATEFDCQGSEARLEDCSYTVVGDNGSTCRPYSSTYNSAFAYCYNQSSEVVFSLEHGNYGRVLVTKDGYERYLCVDGYFSYSSGNVLCRGMGYRSGRDYPYSGELQITGVTAWWRNTFNCGGSEPSYAACIRSTWESRTGPVSSSDQCVYNTPSAYCFGTVRLHTPYRNSSGVLGVYHAEQYRGVCADGFDQNALNVVCNSLGFQGGQLGRDSYYNGSPYGIHISNVSCTGTEKSFDQCTYQFSENQINSCTEKVVPSCFDPNDPDSSLPDSSIKLDNMGRVLIKQHGMWGTICYDGWDDKDAEVACKQLGYDNGTALQIQLDNYKPRFYKNMNCSGSETSLDECSREVVSGYCYYTFDSGAYCYNSSSSAPSFSLIDGNSTNAGKVQITIEGETRYLCDKSGYFNYQEANLVCRNLGFISGQEYKEIETHEFPYGAPFWSNNVDCQNRVDFVDACTNGPWVKETNNGQSTCYYNVPAVYCYGIVRLHTPFKNSSGVLAIYHAEGYHGVCADGFDQNAINVVCNSLGFQGGQLGRDSYFGGSPYGIRISNVSCTGMEKSFNQCTYQYSENQIYSCSEKVVLSCFDPNDPDSSLPDGSIKFGQQSRILIKQYGMWGTICYDDWGDKDAEVACKQLGYDKGSALQIQHNNYIPRFYKNMNCSGSETSLDECNKEVVSGGCYYTFDAGAYCSNGIEANQYSLVHGDGIRYGRLMVTRHNETGFVCSPNYSFDYAESNVMCRQFGFTEGEKLNMPVLEPGYGTVFWENGIDCYTNVPSIDACLQGLWHKYNYQGPDGNTCRYHIPSMFCYGQVRLHTKYLNTTGAVLVRHNEKWIAVCNDGFDDKAAQVVCGEMGFVPGMGQVLPNNSYDNSIVTSNWHPSVMAVRCHGHEKSFNECSYTIDESRMNCSSTNFISVSCVPHSTTALPMPTTTPSYVYTSPSYSVPIASTNDTAWERSRIVSVKQNGMWGGVCSEGWDDVDALVFCKDFGYEMGMTLRIYRDDHRPLWFYNVRCTGSEASFMDCPHDMQDSQNGTCRYSGRAAAFCYNQAELAQYRLTGGSKPNMGRVEVFTQNKWALLCDLNGFYGDKANIICQTMGYKYGENYYSNNLNNVTGNYWSNSFSCEYGMRILEACENNGWTYEDGSTHSQCSYSQPPIVYCYDEVRLSTRYANSSGAVLVFDGDNNYQSLCAAQFNANAANVVCRQLGFPSGGRLLPGSSYLTYSIPSNISYSCSGAESKLSDCSIQASTCASNNSYASVACIDDSAAPISGNDGDAIVDSQGQVLVLYHGIWGTVCSLDWGDQDASVVCKEAGHMYGKAYEKYDYGGYSNSRPVWIYGIDCSGSEAKLKDCQLRNSDDANSTCRYSASAMAYCYNDTNSVQYSLIGNGSNYGIVQVTRDGKTGYICDDGGFYDNEAKTACKDLGFADGDNYPVQLDYSTNNNWWKSYLSCHNSEPTLQLCSSNNDWNYVSMNSSSYCMYNTLSVFCYGTLRLHTKFANSSGVLLKRENRDYYAFCSDGFNMNSANAVCKDLGFIKARLILPASVYNIGYSVRFFNLECSEGATSMKQCTSVYNSNANCIGEAIAVACDDGKSLVTDGLTRILNDGIVQVSKNGMWGSISGYRWDDADAQVICKEKGYGTGSSKYGMNHDVPRWMFEVNCQGNEMSILDCPYKTTAQNDSRYYSDAAVHCYSLPEGNEYRLEHGNHGRLIRTKDNKEGYVCDTGYVDYEDATVVCKTLGYSRGEKYTSPGLYNGTNWWGVDISCYSGYPVLESCITNSNWTYGSAQNNYMLSSCNENYHMMSVYCYGKVKLHLPFGNGSGIILVQSDYNGEVAVCADGFDLTEGDVACREMGYSGISRIIPAASYSYLSYQIGAYRFNCNGGESSLLNCSYTNETCSYGNYAAVECGSYATTTAKTYYNGTNQPYYNTTYPPYYNTTNPPYYYTTSLPYYNTTNPPYYYTTSPPYYSNNSDTLASTNNIAWMRNRRVTVKQNGMWRGICFEGWDDVDATVFCKELGYEAGMALPIYLYDQKVRWGYNVRCSGSEPSLLDCPYDTKSDNGSCSYGPEAGAFCYNTSELAQYRLIGGSKPNMGRVEVFTQNKWALLCDTYGFHGEKANIVCKSMGYKSGETYYANDLNNMTGDYWKTSFSSCEYGMRLLEACKISDWTYQTASSYSECSYSQPASVYCYNEVRLSTMYANSSGAVLVFDGDNNYRSLCAAQFNANAANVVCRQLGFPSGGQLLPGSSYLTYSIPSNISYSCSGAESKLSDCSIQASTCASNNSYASVACINDNAAPISGNDGDAIVDSQGQVLVLYHGIWGTVCSLDWGDQDASVVCKEAGHMYGKAYEKYDYGGYSNSRPVWIYGTDCSGSEAKLMDCQLRNSDDANSTCRYSASAMAYCYNDTNSVQYSLVGSGSNYGIVQVTRDGKTGYICDDGGFYDNEAKTACKDLGFADGDNYPVQLDYSSNNNWWKSYLSCHNSEPTLQLCSNNNDWNYVSMNSSSYCMYNTLSVFCYGTLRLHTKFADSSGILLKRENRNYYAFCSDGFNMNSANAVCKDLGFIKARLILPASVYNIGYSVRFFNLQCSDGATSMKQCTSVYNSNANCIGEAIAIACDDGQPLVKDGLTKISADGLVEVSKNGMWGTINSYKWDDIDAQVICKENGFEAGKTLNSYMYTEGARWMYEVECIGSETSIFDCPYKSSAENASSTYYNNAGVYCYNPSTADELRLENGSYGRLLWTRNNTTGYVCDFDYIDNDDANTVCKTLGYTSGYKYPSASLPPGTEWWGASFVCNDKPILEACLMSPLQYGSDKNNSSFSKCYGDSNTFSVHCSGNATHTNHTAVTPITPYTPNYNSTSRAGSTTPSQQQNSKTSPNPVEPASRAGSTTPSQQQNSKTSPNPVDPTGGAGSTTPSQQQNSKTSPNPVDPTGRAGSTTPSQQQNSKTSPNPVDPADPPVIDTTSESTNNSDSGSSNLHTSATSFSMLISLVVMVLVCIVDHK